MDPLAHRVARRFMAELLTKQWLMGVRRGWLSLMNAKPHGWSGIFKAFDHLREFVDNLEAQVFYVRRGPYTSLPSMTESQELKAAFKKLRDTLVELRRSAAHWMEVEHQGPDYMGRGTFTPDQGVHMREMYETKFPELLMTHVPTKINPAKGQWNPTRSGSITELLDKVLELLRADAARLDKAIKTEEQTGIHETKPEFEESAFKEFAIGNAKIIVTDPVGHGRQIPKYVNIARYVKAAIERRGFGAVWYGVFMVESSDYRKLTPWEIEDYAKAGYKDLQAVAGTFHTGADIISLTAPPNERLIKTWAHELGHRWWFKKMKPEGRARFEESLAQGILPVSEYGKSNAVEAFAEAFSWYVIGWDMDKDQLQAFRSVLAADFLLMAPALREELCADTYSYSRPSPSSAASRP